jgi:eukaryotic-like serine/threonine-protein kinase
MIGKTLGHYQISGQLGKGGMGEVYRATDSKLGRDVAIKVLPEEFAKDADRVARFQREAKLLALLNHPNIAAIYGLEESSGTNFLVLELVEGDTLAERIPSGPIPVEESLKLALQIAEALEAAHEKGVIHRDLKPANIKVTPDGKVKVLDFGLAKAFAGEQPDLNLSNSPTLTNAATQQGVILGTAGYIPPEQARGKGVDKRADIWAFGCVLYEMLTGRQTWAGDNVTDIIAAAIAKDPDFSRLPANLNLAIPKLLRQCLQKDPVERIRDAGDLRIEIRQILADPAGLFAEPAPAAKSISKFQTMIPWAVVLLATIAGLIFWFLKSPEPRRVLRFDCELPKNQQLSPGPFLAVAPDGYQFVYGTSAGLYLRSMGELDARLIPGSDPDPRQPFFSSDGQWVGYWATNGQTGSIGSLKKIAVSGGAPIVLAEAVTNPLGPSWGADNAILYGQFGKGIMRCPASGGVPKLLIESKGQMLTFPQLLPDGKTVLFTQGKQIAVQSTETGKRKALFEGSMAHYLPAGHIIYGSQNTLYAIPFNPNALEPSGEPVRVLQDIRMTGLAVPLFACSDSGTLIYVPEEGTTALNKRSLVWVDRSGKEEPIPAPPNAYFHPRISPDGSRIALTVVDPISPDIWVWDLLRKTMSRLTFDEPTDLYPLWATDGKEIVYFSAGEKIAGICRKPADGTGEARAFGSESRRLLLPSCWSGDGNNLVLETISSALDATGLAIGSFMTRVIQVGQATSPGGTLIGIEMMAAKNEHGLKSLLREKYWQANPQISPNGRWMAYFSQESGKREVYVRPFPDVNGGKWQVSTGRGSEPKWAHNGHELFYRDGDAVMAVAVETAPSFKAGEPKMLFRGSYFSLIGEMWDVSPDDKRFLMLKPESGNPAAGSSARINVFVNWSEELKQRVPAK